MVTVKVWSSFSSNNSASYTLVARFKDTTRAAEVGSELTQLLGEHPSGPDSMQQLSQAAGFEWDEVFPYGGDDDPSVVVDREVVALYHSYCEGFPDQLSAWLRARGAEVGPQAFGALEVSVLFTLPTPGDDLGLGAAFAAIPPTPAPGKWRSAEIRLPWSPAPHYAGETAWFCDGHTAALCAPASPSELALLKTWLAERGVRNATTRLCEPDDAAKFNAMAAARCTGCDSPDMLRYVAPERFGLDAEQLACTACGAMFTLSSFLSAASNARR